MPGIAERKQIVQRLNPEVIIPVSKDSGVNAEEDKYAIQRRNMQALNEQMVTDPHLREKRDNARRISRSSDSFRQKAREIAIKKFREDPDYLERRTKALRESKSTTASREAAKAVTRKLWENPAYAHAVRQSLTDVWSRKSDEEKEQYKQMVSEKAIERYRNPGYIDEVSNVKKKVLPLAKRGFTNSFIASVTELNMKSIQNYKNRARTSDPNATESELPRPTKEDEILAKSIARKEALRIAALTPEQQEEYRGNIVFAKKVCEAGYVTKDLTYWRDLNSLYGKHKREVPEDIKLRLEVLVIALDQSQKGNHQLLDAYKNLTKEIDGAKTPENIVAEEKFIQSIKDVRGHRVAELSSRYHNYMMAIARRYVGNDAAEDAVQTALMKLLASKSTIPLKDSEHEKALIIRVVRSVSLDMIRTQNTHPQTSVIYQDGNNNREFDDEGDKANARGIYGKEKSAEEEVVPRETWQKMLRDIFQRAGQVDPVVILKINGSTFQAIADKYNITPDQARWRYVGSLNQLRDAAVALGVKLDFAS